MTRAYEVDGLKVAQARLALPKENGRHISQAALADRIGCHVVTLSNIERGKHRNLSVALAGRLADAVRKPLAELLVDQPAEDVDIVGAADNLADALHAFASALTKSGQHAPLEVAA